MNQIKIPFFKNAIKVSYTSKGVTEISFVKSLSQMEKAADKIALKIQKQIQAYLEGKNFKLELPIDWENLKGTDFQKKVWKKMTKIPYGKVVSYGALAKSVDSPKGARAVGTACAKNPVLLIIPCHRIVGSTGLGGFSGGGLSVKRQLLSLENAQY